MRARSADFRATLNTRREKSWHKTTVGKVCEEIAARHKLETAIGADMAAQEVDHIDQTNESDGSFLMRLARQYGAIASVKAGRLLFIRQGQGKTASGKPLPVATITRGKKRPGKGEAQASEVQHVQYQNPGSQTGGLPYRYG